MGLIKHNVLDGQLSAVSGQGGPRAFLVCGEPFLVRRSFDRLTAELLQGQPREFALETLDGKVTPVGDIVEQVSTYSFLQTPKVIAVKDAPLFSSRSGAGDISYSAGDMDVLTALIEKGIPDNHALVMTCGAPDRRKKIYKLINQTGLIIDCTVAQGERKADLEEQRAVLRDLARQMLAGSGKTMNQAGFNALNDQTGFNPEVFTKNIEKLLAYTGARSVISVKDIMAVVHRDKKDPVFSLSNAVMDRDTSRALTLLSSLFAEGFHPLQILKTLENQTRKLLAIKCGVLKLYSENSDVAPLRTMQFNRFKQVLLPRIVALDQQTVQRDKEVDGQLTADQAQDGKRSASKKPSANDLLLAPNPKNPYPVFQNFLKSENFSLDELADALRTLADLDYSMKSSGGDAKIGIENFIMTLCRKNKARG